MHQVIGVDDVHHSNMRIFWVLESETVHALVQPRDLLRAPAPTGW